MRLRRGGLALHVPQPDRHLTARRQPVRLETGTVDTGHAAVDGPLHRVGEVTALVDVAVPRDSPSRRRGQHHRRQHQTNQQNLSVFQHGGQRYQLRLDLAASRDPRRVWHRPPTPRPLATVEVVLSQHTPRPETPAAVAARVGGVVCGQRRRRPDPGRIVAHSRHHRSGIGSGWGIGTRSATRPGDPPPDPFSVWRQTYTDGRRGFFDGGRCRIARRGRSRVEGWATSAVARVL